MSGHWLTRRTGLVATAPPATRLSTQSVLDEDTRPSAPEPGADVTFSRRGLAAGQHLIDVHDRYRAELEQVRDLLARVAKGITAAGQARGELNRLTIRANDWTLGGACQMQCVALTEHHGTEDAAVFPHLGQSQSTLRDVLVQHPAELGPVTEAIDLLTDTLLSHFAYEESELAGPAWLLPGPGRTSLTDWLTRRGAG